MFRNFRINVFVIALLACIAGVCIEKVLATIAEPEFIKIEKNGPEGASITLCALNTAINDYFNDPDVPGKPTLKDAVRLVFEKDKRRHRNAGLVGYLNAHPGMKERYIRDLKGWQFSDEEIEQILAPVEVPNKDAH
jgi:hypothetical protein